MMKCKRLGSAATMAGAALVVGLYAFAPSANAATVSFVLGTLGDDSGATSNIVGTQVGDSIVQTSTNTDPHPGYTDPFFSGPNAVPQLGATFNVLASTAQYGALVVALPGGSNGLSFLWGTPNVYNHVAFYDGSTFVADFTGADLPLANQADPPGTAGQKSTPITFSLIGFVNSITVVFSDGVRGNLDGSASIANATCGGVAPNSNCPAFEFASVNSITTSNIGSTPLPAALPLFASGLGAMGLAAWRKRRKAA